MNKKIVSFVVVIAMVLATFATFPVQANAASSSIKGSGIKYPTTITQGSGFGVVGTITSTYKLVEVKAGIMSVSTGQFYPSYTGTAKPNSTTYNLKNLDSKVLFSKALPGTYYYTVTAKDSKGTTVTLLKQKFTVKAKSSTSTTAASSITGSGIKYPTTLTEGSGFGVVGTIKSTYKLTEVKAGIMSVSTGQYYPSYTGTANPNSTTYNLANLDSKVPFSKALPGTYYYTVTAKDAKGTTVTLLKQKFTVNAKSTAAASSITASSLVYPTTITQGSTFTVGGTIKSTYNLKEVKAGVMKVSTGEFYPSYVATVNPNSTSYNLANLASSITFQRAIPGTYYYTVIATDVKGYTKTLVKQAFTVTAKTASSITASDLVYPTSITEGSTFTVGGTIKSTYNLKEVKAGVMKVSTGEFYPSYVATVNPNSTSYNLANLASSITFQRAIPGTYYYTVIATDVNGYTTTLFKQKFTVTENTYTSYDTIKSGRTTANVNMRKGPSTSTSIILTVPSGKIVNVLGVEKQSDYNWYKVTYNGQEGYIRGDYVKVLAGSSTTDLSSFPASYQTYIKKLQEEYPNWNFVAVNTGIDWSTLIKNEMRTVSRQLVEPTSPDSWKSKADGAIDKDTGEYVTFDGRWNAASEAIVKYYLDPRNFLNADDIFQFMTHEFDSSFQNLDTIAAGASGSFLATSSMYQTIYNAGKNSGVNPNAIVSMIIMEQGWKGTSSLISGTYKGYEGYYNYFNIGAYTTSTMSAVERGLWYAKGSGTGATSYGRPWNSKEKSITGGALFYKSQYMDNNQDTYYTKKFNVTNGASNAGTHEYCTNVQAALTEGKLLKRGFTNSEDLPLTFYIPVYNNMPSSNCAMPT